MFVLRSRIGFVCSCAWSFAVCDFFLFECVCYLLVLGVKLYLQRVKKKKCTRIEAVAAERESGRLSGFNWARNCVCGDGDMGAHCVLLFCCSVIYWRICDLVNVGDLSDINAIVIMLFGLWKEWFLGKFWNIIRDGQWRDIYIIFHDVINGKVSYALVCRYVKL